jgi:hypothetical protein
MVVPVNEDCRHYVMRPRPGAIAWSAARSTPTSRSRSPAPTAASSTSPAGSPRPAGRYASEDDGTRARPVTAQPSRTSPSRSTVMPSWRSQSRAARPARRLTVELADDPPPVLLHVGPADVRLHVELADQRGQHGSAHLGLGERQLHPDLTHGSSSPAGFGGGPVQHPVHAARRKPSRSSATKAKPAPRTAATTSSAGHHLAEDLRLELEPGRRRRGGAPGAARTRAPQRRLGRVDRLEATERDRGAVGQAGGQAGGGRLVPGAQAQLPRPVPDVVLGEAGLDQGERRAGGGRGGLARAGGRPGR